VPYNIFLGSGIAGNQGLRELRVGLAVAIGLGGAISMAVLVVGSAVPEPFSFEALGAVLSERLGGWAAVVFAIGLLGAGLSSAITAPLAAAVTARSLFGDGSGGGGWSKRSWRYRAVWAAVLLIGMGFGLSNVRSIPAIVLAQALNGLLLPLVTIFLFLAINDRQLMGERVNGALANALMTAVVWVTLILGGSGLVRALGRVVGVSPPRDTPTAILTGLLALSLALLTLRSAVRRRA
jgi:Mn2+/Fe2+ NRAMP family transporter